MKLTKFSCRIAAIAVASSILLTACGGGASSTVSSADQAAASMAQISTTAENAAGTGAKEFEGSKFEMTTAAEGAVLDALKTVIADFEEESGADIVLTEYPRADYGNALKTRMAAGELPDVLETNGWSRLRYGEYLMTVNDEPWYKDEIDVAKGILQGDGEDAYALMLTSSVLGVFCNKTAAESAGVDIYAINTLDDYKEACQKIIDAGMVPMVNHNSAGDLTHVAGVFTTYEDAISCDAEAQLNGTWDWESFMAELEYFADLVDMGAYWKDRTTMGSTEDVERIASGKSVFYFGNNTMYSKSCEEINPDAEFAVIPFPAASETAKRYIAGGEGYAVGINKDSKELEACRAWLRYLAENGGPIAQEFGGIPAISTLEVEQTTPIVLAAETMEKYPDAVYVNMWDREYMPSGMWGSFGEASGMFYADSSPENLVAIKDFLKQNYDEKYAAAHAS